MKCFIKMIREELEDSQKYIHKAYEFDHLKMQFKELAKKELHDAKTIYQMMITTVSDNDKIWFEDERTQMLISFEEEFEAVELKIEEIR